VEVNVEAYTSYQVYSDGTSRPVPGYACTPNKLTSVIIPYAGIDPDAPQFVLTGMALVAGYIAWQDPCPCAGRILTFTVTK
jgi:hypothetical protein